MKKTIALLLVFCMLMSMLPGVLAEEVVVTETEDVASVELSDAAAVDMDDLDLAEGLDDIDLSLPVIDDLGQLDLVGEAPAAAEEGGETGLDNAAKSSVPSKLTLGQKQTYALDTAEMAKGKTVTYTSSKPKVASVDKSGVITAKAKGKTEVKCVVGKKAIAKCTVTVVDAPDSVTLNPGSIELSVNGAYQIVPTLPNGTMASFTYTSKNSKVAMVTEAGLVTGIKAGETIVVVKTHNKKTATLSVTVKKAQSSEPKAPNKVTLNIHKSTLGTGDTLQLKATLPKKTASVLTWKSDKPSVAKVDDAGKVTAVGAGTAKITVTTANGKTDSCEITVRKAPDKVTITPDKVTLAPGASVQLSATLPKDTTSDLTWKSNKASVATVNENGLVTAVKAGTAKITVKTYNGVTDTCVVTVKNGASSETKAPNKVTLDVHKATLSSGETLQLTATLPKGTSSVLTWESSDTAVATVKNGVVTAGDAGTATITVTTDNKKKDTCEITVKKLPDKVKLNASQMTLVPMETFYLIASLPKGTTSDLTWKSSKPAVAKVNDDGLVTAVKAGTAKITVTTVNNKTASCTVTVETPSLESASAVQDSFNIAPTENATLQVKAKCVRNPALSYSWSVNGEEIPGANGSSYTAVGGKVGSYAYKSTVSDGTNAIDVAFTVNVDNGLKAEATSATEQTVFVGATAVLSVSGSCAAGQPTYRWYAGDTLIEGATEASYTTGPVNAQTVFTCEVGDEYGSTPVKLAFTVSVKPNTLTEATAETASFQLKPTEKATLRVIAKGEGELNLSYRWFLNDAEISGASGASYEVTAGNVGSYAYKCTVSDRTNAKDVAFAVKVDNGLKAEATSATEQTVFLGATAVLSASGSCAVGKPTYRWYAGDALIEGATGASYTTGPVNAKTVFTCEVGDEYGSAPVKLAFTVSVKARTLSEASAVQASFQLKPTEKATLQVIPVGEGDPELSYRWFLNDTEISGASGASYEVTAGNVGSYAYKCTVSDGTNAKDVAFTVNVDNGLTASAKSASEQSVLIGQAATLEVSAGCQKGDLNYKWYKGDTAISDATGASYAATENTAGSYAYKCVVGDAYGSAPVTVSFTVTAREPSLTGASAEQETLTVAPTQKATMKAVPVCDGEPALSYAWYEGDSATPIPDASEASYTMTAGNVGSYAYKCTVSDGTNAKDVAFTVNVDNGFTVGAESESEQVIVIGQTATLEVSASATTSDKISYQWYAGDDRNTVIGTEASYTTEAIDTAGSYGYTCVVGDGYGSAPATVSFTVTAQEPQLTDASAEQATVTVAPTQTATMKAVPVCFGEPALSYTWYEGESATPIPGASEASYTVTAGNVGEYAYKCTVSDGNADHDKDVEFTVIVDNGLTASADGDAALTVAEGETATLKVTASCTIGGLTYAWYEGESNTPIQGAESASYTTEAIDEDTSYRCVVSDAYGSAAQTVTFTITLETVDPGYTLSAYAVVPYVTIDLDDTPQTLAVQVEPSDAEGLTYSWSYRKQVLNDQGQMMEPSNEWVTIEGANAATYALSRANAYTTTYRCTVKDQYKSKATADFNVNVQNNLHIERDWANSVSQVAYGGTATLATQLYEGPQPLTTTPDGLSYSWYKRVGDSYERVEGETESSISVGPVTARMEYNCVVVDAHWNRFETMCEATVDNHLYATDANGSYNPVVCVMANQTVTLTAKATCDRGQEELSYQWYEEKQAEGGYGMDRIPIEGATGTSWTTGNITADTKFVCEVKDGFGNTAFVTFTVQVLDSSSATELSLNAAQTVTIANSGEYKLFSFTPGTAGWYAFRVESDDGMTRYATLLDQNGEEIATEQKYGAFKLVHKLTAGTQYYFTTGYTMGNGGNTPYTVVLEKDSAMDNMQALTLDTSAPVTISTPEQTVYFSFVPTATGYYRFSSTNSDNSTIGSLYNENMQEIKMEYGYNEFSVVQELTQGKTYYLGVGFSDPFSTGSFDVCVTVCQGLISAKAEQSNFTVAPDTEVTMQVNAQCTDGESLTYRWYKSGNYGSFELINGQESAAYPLTATLAGSYRCEVSDTHGNKESVDFWVNIENGFTVNAVGNTNLNAEMGATVELEVAASCTNGTPSIQWYEGGNAIDGATGLKYTTKKIHSQMTDVRCQVSDIYGNESNVYFYITCPNYVPNNLMASAVNGYISVSPTETATLEANATAANLTDMTCQWFYIPKTLDEHGEWKEGEWTSLGEATAVTVENGQAKATLALSGSELHSTRYRCVFTDLYEETADVEFSVTVERGLWMTWDSEHTNSSVALGESATLTSQMEKDWTPTTVEGLTYSWYKLNGDSYERIDNATGLSYTVASVTHREYYLCVAVDDYWNKYNNPGEVEVNNNLYVQAANEETIFAVPYGGQVALKVVAEYTTGPVEYHWSMWALDGGDKISLDCTGDTYTIEQVTADSAYACEVTDSYGNSRMREFSVTILDASRAIPLSLDKPETTVPEGQWAEGILYTFTPQETGSYIFQGTGAMDGNPVYCALYDSAMDKITRAETTSRVKLCRKLNAGETYYFKTGYTIGFGGSEGDTYTVELSRLQALTLDTAATVNISENGQVAYFSFTPQTAGDYSFSSFTEGGGYLDTFGTLYDEDMREITSDAWSGENGHFRITHELTAGSTYYIAARLYDNYSTGSFKVRVETVEYT